VYLPPGIMRRLTSWEPCQGRSPAQDYLGHLQYALKTKLSLGATHATNELDSTTHDGCMVHVGSHSDPEQVKSFM